MASRGSRLVSVDYEVFGRVQGVFFRKYTHDKAKDLGLVGWVKNTSQGTVVGTVQGPEDKVNIMKDWLRTKGSPWSEITNCVFKDEKSVSELKKEWLAKTGSPKSRIENCVFSSESEVSTLKYSDFVIDKPPKKKKTAKATKPR